MVAKLKEATGQNKPGRACLIDDRDFILLDTELLADFEKASLCREIGSAPLAVGLRVTSVGQGSGDENRVFVDVECEV
ncbi:MAG: hypothetical protein AAGA96_15270 [Verrucomicrobiota bacterium]